MADTLAERLEFAHRLADAAGNIIRPYFRKRIDVTDKGAAGFYDPVTEADRRAEVAIRDLIQLHYPQDAVLGEELGEVPGTTAYRWVIDPIDGTRAFIAGQPLWGTLIGLERERVPVFGILDQPFLPERFVGFEGSAQLQNVDGITPLTTRECERLADAVICTTHPMAHFNDAERAQFTKIENACRLSRYGGDCYAYGLIAMGFVDLVMEARLAHWDIAPLIPILEGAGGVLTDWEGKPWHAGANVLAAGDRRIHVHAVELLSRSR